ncbi:FAD-dependent monooxygenase [Asticcacaulis solisilvae]|uniref:FAD-dependent monooxygenase n=1 Tax=Asticcacaulis solisilvae TaxID=1217274 RepID=UPI003FD8146A
MDDLSYIREPHRAPTGTREALTCDVVIVGGGFAGALMALVLARRGLSPVVVDPHDIHPQDFRCEKFSLAQVDGLVALGVADAFAPLFGRNADAMTHRGLRYDQMVNALREHWGDGVRLVRGKVTAVARDHASQTLTVAGFGTVTSRLCVLATGPGERLLKDLGVRRQVLSPDHSVCIGFTLLPGPDGFGFDSLIHRGEKPGDGAGFVSLFRMAGDPSDALRANLFLYDAIKSERVLRFRRDPLAALLAVMPGLKGRLGGATVAGEVELRATDLYTADVPDLEGVVLIGDARRTSCPASGTGISRIINDVRILADRFLPDWLAAHTEVSRFYADAAVHRLDADLHRRSMNGRSLAVDTGAVWRLKRLAHKARAMFTRPAPPAAEAHFYTGDGVRVRSAVEILASLDMDGTLDGLPFMPEMVAHIGQTARVFRRADRTCVEGHGLRGMKDVVFLDQFRCDGRAHDNCQRDCLMFWKEAWLAPDGPALTPTPRAEAAARQTLLHLATRGIDGRYTCQSTELARASHALSKTHLGALLSELKSGELKPQAFGTIVWRALVNKARAVMKLPELGQIVGPKGSKSKGDLNLQPGEWVRVRDAATIRATLNGKGRNLGLSFEPEMERLIGQVRQVDRVVERMVHEETGEMVRLERTVSLKSTYCKGACAKSCPRANPLFWREVWLERVPAPE